MNALWNKKKIHFINYHFVAESIQFQSNHCQSLSQMKSSKISKKHVDWNFKLQKKKKEIKNIKNVFDLILKFQVKLLTRFEMNLSIKHFIKCFHWKFSIDLTNQSFKLVYRFNKITNLDILSKLQNKL